MDNDKIKVAQYRAMFSSWAFKDFLGWLDERVDHYEGLCCELRPESKDKWEEYFRKWQERKMLQREILSMIEYNTEQVKQEQEENERSSESAVPTVNASSSTYLPGY